MKPVILEFKKYVIEFIPLNLGGKLENCRNMYFKQGAVCKHIKNLVDESKKTGIIGGFKDEREKLLVNTTNLIKIQMSSLVY